MNAMVILLRIAYVLTVIRMLKVNFLALLCKQVAILSMTIRQP